MLERNGQKAEAYILNLQLLSDEERKVPLAQVIYDIVDCFQSSNILWVTFHTQRIVLLTNRVHQHDRFFAFHLPERKISHEPLELKLIAKMNIPLQTNLYNKFRPLASKDLEMLVYEQSPKYGNDEDLKLGKIRVFRVDYEEGFEEIFRTNFPKIQKYAFRKNLNILTFYKQMG